MKQLAIGALGTVGALAVGGAIALYAGVIDVAADTPHHGTVFRLIEFARERSIARASRDLTPPADLADAERIRRGAGNYDAMCADCHLAPGRGNSEIRQGLYPEPPDLSQRPAADGSAERATARRFWIVKHGIKASGMPAWSKGGMEDAAIWDIVAFLNVLPTLSPAQYRQQVASSDGHAHGGVESTPPEVRKEAGRHGKPHRHDHDNGHAH